MGYPTLIEMMKNAHGKHLYICAPEIDAVPTGLWFQNGSTLRLAFDNERGGQDTKSAKAVSGYLPFYLNACMSGTPSAVMNRYNNSEDGLVTRTIFCSFPVGERGMKRVADQQRSARNLRAVQQIVEGLMAYGEIDKTECEPVRLGRIERAILNFYEMKGDLYNMTHNESIETFRTRAAVIGMRAGALAWLMEGKRESRAVIDFALWVAEYTLYYQIKFFGEKLDQAVLDNAKVLTGKTLTSNDVIFAQLDEDFSNPEVVALFRARGKQGTGVCQTCHRWEESGWIVGVSRGQWRKTLQGKKRGELLRESLALPSVGTDAAGAEVV